MVQRLGRQADGQADGAVLAFHALQHATVAVQPGDRRALGGRRINVDRGRLVHQSGHGGHVGDRLQVGEWIARPVMIEHRHL